MPSSSSDFPVPSCTSFVARVRHHPSVREYFPFVPSSELPHPDRLLERIEQHALTADRRRLVERVHALRDSRTPPPESDIRRLVDDTQRSIDRARERFDRKPAANLDLNLPIAARRDEIARAIDMHQVIVLCGETGSGKTTQLPQICLDLARGVRGLIGHTQPRRIAARAVAQRLADELGTQLGPRGHVGYKVRFGDESSPANFVRLMTDGILLAETAGDPLLENYDTIIVDEAHERSLNIDFLLGYLRQLLPTRPDLKLIITSATIDPQRLSTHFGGPEKAPVIEVSGRTYPVEIRYRPTTDIEADDWENIEELAILDAVDELCRPPLPPGDILVFLPGEREIRNVADALRKYFINSRAPIEILPLYARLSPAEQQRVFGPSPRGGRRVVLATNVAETSLTVPGIRYVIDAGLARISRYNHRSKVQRLPIEAISQASANQRSGRCGRVAAGVAIRLYGEDDFKARPAFTDPEILRTNLASVILQMKALRLGAVEAFPFVEPPDARMIRDGYETLEELGAVDDAGELTPLGKRLARLPIDPRIGRMLLAAETENCVAEALVICAALEVQDPRDRPMEKQAAADQAQAVFRHETSDFQTYLNIWTAYHHEAESSGQSRLRAWCRDYFLNFMRMREWVETYRQLKGLAEEMGLKEASQPANYDRLHRALLTGLLSSVACKNDAAAPGANAGHDYLGARSTKVAIFPGSALFKKGPRWLMAAEIVQTTKLYSRTCAKIEPEWIEHLAGHVVKRTYTDQHWHREGGHASVWERVLLFGLVVVPRRRANLGAIDPKAARDLLIHHALIMGEWPEGRRAQPFEAHNARIIEQVKTLEAKLRRTDLLADHAALHRFFDRHIPNDVYAVGPFDKWYMEKAKSQPRVLELRVSDVLADDAGGAGTGGSGDIESRFPDAIALTGTRNAEPAALEYAFEPGKEIDGITAILPITALPQLDPARCQWLVPGFLREKVHALLKTLPKSLRLQLDSGNTVSAGAAPGRVGLAILADECAGVMTFAEKPLGAALSEAVEVLRSVRIPESAWQEQAIPDYLRLSVRVVDDHGKALGESRDIADLKARLAGRARKALAGAARAQFGREGLTTWDFDDLPERFELDRGGEGGGGGGVTVVAFPALADRGEHAALTLAETEAAASASTHRGVRRLLALACKDEVAHRLSTFGGPAPIESMYKWFAPLGPPAELKAALIDLIVERAFLAGQPAIRTRAAFEDRQTACWGKLGQATIEVVSSVARILESRHKVAAKLGSGTPRTWAVSVADIREHAAYLMPKGFLTMVPRERLAEYPRYVEAMWLRLTKLREDGSPREARALAELAPHWKRYTGWVARHASAAKANEAEHATTDTYTDAPSTPSIKGGTAKGTLALPAARRAAPVVPTEAAAWAARPGELPQPLETYRWMLEEFRVSLFAQELGTAQTVSAKRLDEQWGKVPE